MTTSDCLVIKDITFAYRKNIPILKGVSATFKKGKITALLGNNGSGKTTLLRILAGITHPNSGYLIFNNEIINESNITQYKKAIGFMPELLQMYPEVHVTEVLTFFARLKGKGHQSITKILERVGLKEHAYKRVRALSKGMKQRLNLAQAIINSPEIIIFDEPSNGFDCSSVIVFYDILKELAERGAVVILSNHQLSELQSNVDTITVLSDGQIIKEVDVEEYMIGSSMKTKRVWLYFSRVIEEDELKLLNTHYPNMAPVDKHVLMGDVDKEKISDLIVFAKEKNLQLANIRVESRELEELLGGHVRGSSISLIHDRT